MTGRKSERIQKQKCQRASQSAEPSAKRPKDESPEQMKITDLNDDCLEHVFKKLDLVDLVNVADSRKSFREGVDQAFTSKYGRRKIMIIYQRNGPLVDERKEKIKIYDFVTALKFMRCFGKINTALKIDYDYLFGQQKRRHELDRYLNDYCTETLKDLTFVGAPKGAIARLKQPFKNVQKLFVSGELGRKMGDFKRLFPKMQHLTLYFVRSFAHCIEVHLPQLKHLKINDGYSLFQLENIEKCIRLNPQLRTLEILNPVNLPSILKSASELLQLEELHIRFRNDAFVNIQDVILFKNVKKFILHQCAWWSDPISKLPLSFEKLEEFLVVGLPPRVVIQEFIRMNPSVKKMGIDFCRSDISDDLKKELQVWSFGTEWHAFNFGNRIEFVRGN